MTYSTYEHAGFQLRYADIEEACYRLWSIKDVQDNCSFKPENGSYSNFASGEWFKTVSPQIEKRGSHLLALILHSDATTGITNFNGRCCHPVSMTFGNLPLSHINNAASRITIGYFPVFPKKTEKRLKVRCMQRFYEKLLLPLTLKRGTSTSRQIPTASS